jgi:hypothetical protein
MVCPSESDERWPHFYLPVIHKDEAVAVMHLYLEDLSFGPVLIGSPGVMLYTNSQVYYSDTEMHYAHMLYTLS